MHDDKQCHMSNINASEDNTESPSAYGDTAYKDYREKEKKKRKAVIK